MGAGAEELFYQYVLCLCLRAAFGAFPGGGRETFPGAFYCGGGGDGGGNGAADHHGTVLLRVGFYGLLHRGGAKPGEELRPDGDRDLWGMCVPCHMDLYNFCIF